MYRFALTRHCGLDPQSAEHYEIPRQARRSNLFAWLAKNDENHKIYTLLPTPIYYMFISGSIVPNNPKQPSFSKKTKSETRHSTRDFMRKYTCGNPMVEITLKSTKFRFFKASFSLFPSPVERLPKAEEIARRRHRAHLLHNIILLTKQNWTRYLAKSI